MIKQREESEKIYADAGRAELAKQEGEEIVIIREFLPKQLSDAEMEKAIAAAIAKTGAASVKDMGKVMAELKARYAGQMDFAKASAAVKAKLRLDHAVTPGIARFDPPAVDPGIWIDTAKRLRRGEGPGNPITARVPL